MKAPKDILKQYWGHEAFRPLQEDIILHALEGKDTLAVLPTGGGKSICFQVPALLLKGCSIVISPLIALMEDQVRNLNERGIPAKAIIAGMGNLEVEEVLKDAVEGEIKLLYISPERIDSRNFQEYLPHIPVSMIAVDESHCISQWGYDFRPAYLHISRIRDVFPKVPIIALTASATGAVKSDIISKMKMRDVQEFMTSFSRPNLSYTAENCPDKINRIIQILEKVPGSALVYCKTRRKTKEMSDLLNQFGLSCDYYHAGLDHETRKNKQDDWIRGRTRIIACTNAFGMGIDKPDVRLVIHAELPDCLENYYQEAGRAGRDGNKAYAILLYSQHDINELLELPNIKYPGIETIRKVYHALGNYLQVPAGAGVEQYFDFDLDTFLDRFKLPLLEVINSLQALKQENIISYLDQVNRPAKVQFTCGRNDLSELEKNRPELDPLIKALLRNYSGVWDVEVNINERHLAKLAKRPILEIQQGLKMLDKFGIIHFTTKKESPQIRYIQNRITTSELELNYDEYLGRKNSYKGRIDQMIQYCETLECRSVLIGKYFGDYKITNCGICDNCLKNAKKRILPSEFAELYQKMITFLQKGPATLQTIMNHKIENSTLLEEVLSELKKEGKIGVDRDGRISLK